MTIFHLLKYNIHPRMTWDEVDALPESVSKYFRHEYERLIVNAQQGGNFREHMETLEKISIEARRLLKEYDGPL